MEAVIVPDCICSDLPCTVGNDRLIKWPGLCRDVAFGGGLSLKSAANDHSRTPSATRSDYNRACSDEKCRMTNLCLPSPPSHREVWKRNQTVKAGGRMSLEISTERRSRHTWKIVLPPRITWNSSIYKSLLGHSYATPTTVSYLRLNGMQFTHACKMKENGLKG